LFYKTTNGNLVQLILHVD